MGAVPRWPRAARLGGRTLLGGRFVDYGSRLPQGSAGSTAGLCLGEELLGSYSYGFCGVQQLCHLSMPLPWGFTAWRAQCGARAAGKGCRAMERMDVGASLPAWSSLSAFLPVSIGAASLWKCVRLPGVGFPAAVLLGQAAWRPLAREPSSPGPCCDLVRRAGKGKAIPHPQEPGVCAPVLAEGSLGSLVGQQWRGASPAPAARWACLSRPWH